MRWIEEVLSLQKIKILMSEKNYYNKSKYEN